MCDVIVCFACCFSVIQWRATERQRGKWQHLTAKHQRYQRQLLDAGIVVMRQQPKHCGRAVPADDVTVDAQSVNHDHEYDIVEVSASSGRYATAEHHGDDGDIHSGGATSGDE